MPLASSRRRLILLLAILLITEWVWVFVGRPLPSSKNVPPAVHNKLAAVLKKDIFHYKPNRINAIYTVCAATKWTNDAIFTCDNSIGGIGNVRNSILICTRLAISAGASLVMPKIEVRDAHDISQIRTGEKTTMDYMFDVSHYKASLRLSCPGLKIYDNIEVLPNYDSLHGPKVLQPEDLQEHTPKGLPRPSAWPQDFTSWLQRETAGTLFNTGNPQRTTIVALNRSYLIYPIYSDGTEFAHAFGSILQFRPDVRVLATEVFTSLLRNHGLEKSWDGKSDIVENAYLGAHLRIEKDATEGWPGDYWGWSNYTAQAGAYINQTLGDGLDLIYVASGDLAQISRFTAEASRHNIKVETKHSLLSPTSLTQLNQLSFDQQGLVDFLVMLKASDFAGVAHSSFAWSIALKRHLGSRRRDNMHLGGKHTLSDEWSQVYGQVAGEYPGCVWP